MGNLAWLHSLIMLSSCCRSQIDFDGFYVTDHEELNSSSDDELAYKVFWIACGDINEEGQWYGLTN